MLGRIWWVADDWAEFRQWQRDWEGKPVEVIKVEAKPGSSNLDVIISLAKETASEVLGYEVEECEWLEE